MKILVCISNVPDTTTKIKFTPDNKKLDPTGVQWIINPWDELALTRALELKESSNGLIQKVNVINVGQKDTELTIRKALSMGADEAFRIDAIPYETYYVAYQVAHFLKNNPYDLVITGLESSDFNGNGFGQMLATLSNYNLLTAISGIDLKENKLIFYRDFDDERQTIEAKFPLVVVIQKGIAKEPKIPSMRGIMAARTKPINVIQPQNIQPLVEFIEFQLPPPKGKCKFIDPENFNEVIRILHEEIKII